MNNDKVMEIIEREFLEVAEEICDKYCKYPSMSQNESWLEAICETCPLRRLI